MKGSPRSIEEIGAELARAPDAVETYKALPDYEQLAVRRNVLPTHDDLHATAEQFTEGPDVFRVKYS